MIARAKCHPDKPNKGRGLCTACYLAWQHRTYPERYIGYRSTPQRREWGRKYMQEQRRKFPERYLVIQVRSRAKKLGIPCTITAKDIRIPEKCPILGIPLTKNDEHQRNDSYSIDRIDVSQGYIPGNVKVISMRANRLKNNATLSEILLIADYMLKHAKIGTVS